jgi:hypothetical protein
MEEWSYSSLVLEWLTHKGEPPADSLERVIAERRTDPDTVAELALDRAAKRRDRQMPNAGLQAGSFVPAAVDLLEGKKYNEAVELFAALVELRPGDGEALNNYAFCLLVVDPAKALLALQRASLFDWHGSAINIANTVLCLHLLGRDEESALLARQFLDGDVDTGQTGYLWRHNPALPEHRLECVAVRDYVASLLDHMLERGEYPALTGSGAERTA